MPFRVVLLLISSFFTAVPVLQAQVLYLAAAGETHREEIAETVHAGTTFFTSLFVENLPAENLTVYNGPGSSWAGAEINEAENPLEALKSAIETCPAGENDAILIFWFGKGGFVKNEFQFFLNVPKEREEGEEPAYKEISVPRSFLTLALKEKKVRFAGLISESSKQFKAGNSVRVKPYTPNTSEITSLMSSLFFEPRGFLDLNACRKSQSSLTLPNYGSLMIEGFGEFLETCDYKAARWTETVDAVNTLMAESAKGHKQKLDLFSVPKEAAEEEKKEENANAREKRAAENWRDDWDEIARILRSRLAAGEVEVYPSDYVSAPHRFHSQHWSAPLYYPEPGDLLIGINGRRVLSYRQFIDEIQNSMPQIYLTVIDHRTGTVYEMRTVMGPPGPPVRLGLGVVEESWGGLRVTETAPGSPVSRCQYLIDFRPRFYLPF